MIRAFCAGVVLSVAGFDAIPALAQENPLSPDAGTVVISSGGSGGGYWNAASRLQTVAREVGLEVEVLESGGSLENLKRLTDPESPVNLGLAQSDALQYYLDNNPGAEELILRLEDIGQECVFFVAGKASGIRTDADLQSGKKYRLGISTPDSGTAVTFNYMKTLVPEFGQLEVKYVDTQAAVARLGQADAEVDVVMMVHRPKETSEEVQAAFAQPDRYNLLALEDSRLRKKLSNGQRIYRKMDLAVPAGDSVFALRTICVKGLVLANRQKLTDKQSSLLNDVVQFHWMRVFATE